MIAYVFQKYPENFAFQFFLFLNKTSRLNNLKTRTAMNAKISVFVNCVEAIIYLLFMICMIVP